ncbi:bifunctional peptidase and arginyl-hydroxylase JMJD5-like [Tubulanus polymorphus]|uniref:bifunctional peptidase and arginyl-hydroxylase JMJD5-like n=1 Tax=Tubulanus polymorphus TaxID=672921 RepID=UPI003DA29D4E
MALPSCKNISIAKVCKIAPEQFSKDYLTPGKPVVIQGALDDWPASKWNLNYLCEKVGQNKVLIRGKTNSDEYKVGKQHTIRESTFQEYVNDLLANNSRAQSSYLAVQNIKQAFPQIEAEAPLPSYVGKIHCGPYLWVAHKGHYEYCHIDPDDNFLIMISGYKQLRLFGCDLDNLYPNPFGAKGKTIQSQVDCDNPDLTRFPKFSQATCYHSIIGPGDMLFIPAFWWHQVTSLDVAISVNTFCGDAGDNVYITKIMNDSRWPIFSHWFLNVIEQNRPHESFQRILSRLPEAIRAFILNKWHEHPTDEQIQVLVDLVKKHLGIEELPEDIHKSKYPPLIKIRGLLWRS